MRRKIIFTVITICLIFSVLLSLSIGSLHIPAGDVLLCLMHELGILHSRPVDEMYAGVMKEIRLPRTILGVLVGAGLGISGAAVQGIFRNPLAEPGLIGISSGASLMASFIIALENILFISLGNLLGHYVLALGAFAGAGVAAIAVYQLSKSEGSPRVVTMLLAGIAINALAGALTGLISFIADEQQLRSITFWLLGSLSGATWQAVWGILPFIIVSLIFLPLLAKPLNAFVLGEAQADQLGMRANKVKLRVVFIATLAVGSCVAFTGIIGFIGLLVPHMVRLSGGADHRFVLPASALLGAFTLTASDLIARMIVAPMELPIGVVTALMGTPVFLYILIKDKKKLTH